MNGERFDTIVTRLAARGTRRGMLRLLGGIAGGVLTPRRPVLAQMTCSDDLASGFEVCRSEDNSTVVYRSGSDTLRCHVFRRTSWWGNVEYGGEITTDGEDFIAAQVDVRYFGEAVQQTCSALSSWDADTYDDYLDSYKESYFWGDAPSYLKVLCRAQWHKKRIKATVWRGTECYDVGAEPLPEDYPDDWPPLSQGHPTPPPPPPCPTGTTCRCGSIQNNTCTGKCLTPQQSCQ